MFILLYEIFRAPFGWSLLVYILSVVSSPKACEAFEIFSPRKWTNLTIAMNVLVYAVADSCCLTSPSPVVAVIKVLKLSEDFPS